MLGLDPRAAKYTLTVAIVLCLLYGLFVIRGVLFVLTLSIMLAYLLHPLVEVLIRYGPGKSRTPVLVLVYLLMMGGVAGLGITIGSRAAIEAKTLSEQAPALIDRLKQAPSPETPKSLESLKEMALGTVQQYFYQHYQQFASFLPGITLQILKASTNLLYLIIIPILSFFLLKDGAQLKDELLGLVDAGSARQFAEELVQDIHILLLQYMRALFLLCCVTLVTFSAVLSLMGVPDSILLASVAFPLEFIPLVGPLLAAVVIIAVTVLTGYTHLAWVVIFLAVYRVLQDYVVSPRLMSAGIELHPLLIILGVFAGGEIGGVAGTFLSVPVLALLRVVYRRIRSSRRAGEGAVVAAV